MAIFFAMHAGDIYDLCDQSAVVREGILSAPRGAVVGGHFKSVGVWTAVGDIHLFLDILQELHLCARYDSSLTIAMGFASCGVTPCVSWPGGGTLDVGVDRQVSRLYAPVFFFNSVMDVRDTAALHVHL